MSKASRLPSRKEAFSDWYNTVIQQAQFVDQSPTKGCVVLRPYGFSVWEHIKAVMDAKIKENGVENAYFPLLIPQSFLQKEAEHVEGFSPELAVVTHAGGKKLEEPYVVRPTSETMIYHMFARWIASWRDLPLKINQWANVVRWEMRTRPFLRTTEFLWQEGHTAHSDREEADAMAQKMLAVYIDVIENYLAIPLFTGRKTKKERFAGADETYCMEAMMPDGKALQMGTSHLLAHSFPQAFGVSFQGKDGVMQTPWCTSWGITTRLVGAVLMVHGDDNGVVLPPRIAPHQVVIVPIFRNDEEQERVMQEALQYADILKSEGVRVHVDVRSGERPGAKFFKWEMRGVPLRIEIGPRDVAAGQVLVSCRVDMPECSGKITVAKDVIGATVTTLLDDLQNHLFNRAKQYYEEQTHQGASIRDFGKALKKQNGFYCVDWCGEAACEEKLVSSQAGIRCILDEAVADDATCFGCCGADARYRVVAAKGY